MQKQIIAVLSSTDEFIVGPIPHPELTAQQVEKELPEELPDLNNVDVSEFKPPVASPRPQLVPEENEMFASSELKHRVDPSVASRKAKKLEDELKYLEADPQLEDGLMDTNQPNNQIDLDDIDNEIKKAEINNQNINLTILKNIRDYQDRRRELMRKDEADEETFKEIETYDNIIKGLYSTLDQPQGSNNTAQNEWGRKKQRKRTEEALVEIFNFYSRQHIMIGRKATFEEIQNEMAKINLGEFLKFCKEFSIPGTRTSHQGVFKKVSLKSQTTREAATLKYEDFIDSLPQLFEEESKKELETLEKRMKMFDMSINNLNKEIADLKEENKKEEEEALDRELLPPKPDIPENNQEEVEPTPVPQMEEETPEEPAVPKNDITLPSARSEQITAEEQKKQQEMWVLTEDMAECEREMLRIQTELESKEKMTDKALNYMGILNKSKEDIIRILKGKGFVNPFGTRQKSEKNLSKYNKKPLPKSQLVKIREQLTHMRAEREKNRVDDFKEQEKRYSKGRKYMKQIKNQLEATKHYQKDLDVQVVPTVPVPIPMQEYGSGNIEEAPDIIQDYEFGFVPPKKQTNHQRYKSSLHVGQKGDKKLTLNRLAESNQIQLKGNLKSSFDPRDVLDDVRIEEPILQKINSRQKRL